MMVIDEYRIMRRVFLDDLDCTSVRVVSVMSCDPR